MSGREDVVRELRSAELDWLDCGDHENAELARKAYEAIEQARSDAINAPETRDFMAGVPLEAKHQRERWGSDHDAGKTPEDWFWLIGYLAQKALRAQNAGDTQKALHHTISTAAALANWHAAIAGIDTAMRPGIEPPRAGSITQPAASPTPDSHSQDHP